MCYLYLEIAYNFCVVLSISFCLALISGKRSNLSWSSTFIINFT